MTATSPAFYTLIYKVKDYLNGTRYRLKGGHPAVIRLRHDKLNRKNYVHIIHKGNSMSKFRSKKGKHIDNQRMIKNPSHVKRILSQYI